MDTRDPPSRDPQVALDGPLTVGSWFPSPIPSFPEKAQAKRVYVHVGLAAIAASGSSSGPISVQTSLLLLMLLAILPFLVMSSLGL